MAAFEAVAATRGGDAALASLVPDLLLFVAVFAAGLSAVVRS